MIEAVQDNIIQKRFKVNSTIREQDVYNDQESTKPTENLGIVGRKKTENQELYANMHQLLN